MAEYELVAYHTDNSEPVDSMLFGSRPDNKYVYELAEKCTLGIHTGEQYPPNMIKRLTYECGHMDVIKHIPYKKD